MVGGLKATGACVALAAILVFCEGCVTQSVVIEGCVDAINAGETVTLRVSGDAVDAAALAGGVWTVDRPDRGVFLIDGARASSVTGGEAEFLAVAQGTVRVNFAAEPSSDSGMVAGFAGSCELLVVFPGGSLPGGGSEVGGSSDDGDAADVTDTDGDGTPDAADGCPEDAAKTEPGDCGCGVADDDTNDNSISDCLEEGSVDLTVNVQFFDGSAAAGATVSVVDNSSPQFPICQAVSDAGGVALCENLRRDASVLITATLTDTRSYSGTQVASLSPVGTQTGVVVTVTISAQ